MTKEKAIETMKSLFGVSEDDFKTKKNKEELAKWLKSKNKHLLQWYCGKRQAFKPSFHFYAVTKKEMLRTLTDFIANATEDQLTVWDEQGKNRQVIITGVKLI